MLSERDLIELWLVDKYAKSDFSVIFGVPIKLYPQKISLLGSPGKVRRIFDV